MSTPIYLAGNTPFYLLGLEQIIRQHPAYECSGRYLLNDAQLHQHLTEGPALLLLHLGNRTQSNLGICRQLLKQAPSSRLLVFSEADSSRQVKSFFKLGIRGYALPTICPDELGRALSAVRENQLYLDPRLSSCWATQSLGVAPPAVALTRREQEVLQLIVNEFTTKEIAEKLFISSCTAETHRLNIIHKLGVRNTAGLVREALRQELYG